MGSSSLRRLFPAFRWSSLPWPGRLQPDFRQRPVFKFIEKRSGPFSDSVILSRDRVYIIPTRAGLIFAFLLLLLLTGSINYDKSLGYALTFLLSGIGIISLLATWRNLAGLEVRAQDSRPVFAGEKARFSLLLHNPKPLQRRAVALTYGGIEHGLVNCDADSQQLIHFSRQAIQRGRLQAGRFRLYTEFPTGLFVAWTWLDLSLSCTVYPAPDPQMLQPAGTRDESGDNAHGGGGLEHFSHLGRYQAGDNISRISWKAAARTDELFSKYFTGATPQSTWINWHEIPAQDNEQRLSIMAAMIINADKNQQPYGLVLPAKQVQPALGRAHYHHCMTELALF